MAKILNLLGFKINIYRVGDIIMSTNSRNPGLDYGGTWQLWGQGKVPVGIDTTDTDFDTIEKTGGTKNVTLTIDQIPPHQHVMPSTAKFGNPGNVNFGASGDWKGGDYFTWPAGGGQPHNNLQPYITCYMWKKTA